VDFTSTVDDTGIVEGPDATTEGDGDGDAGDGNSWTVTTTDPDAVTSALAEITWNDVEISTTANAFTYDIQATIGAEDTGVDRVTVTVPASFGDPNVTDVLVGGSSVAYTDNTAAKTISIDLTAKVTSSANIQVLFTSDAPTSADAVGVDFTSTVDDTSWAPAAQATTEGDGDGDAGDNNDWTVTTSDCDDANPCTLDTYDTTTRVCDNDSAVMEGLACNTGLFCTTGQTCTAGVCGGGTAVDCSHLSDTCVVGICDETADACVIQPGQSNWYNVGWQYRKQITIDNTKVTATLGNFPVLVSLTTDADLAAGARSDGFDLLFTSSDGITKLDHEVELFDPNSGELVAWVRVPSLSSSADTLIYLYYGHPNQTTDQQNAPGVWDANHKGVWHMTEVNAVDSTENGNNGTQYNGVTSVAAGKMGPANFFADGDQANGDYVDVGNDPNLQITGALTISAWATIAGSSGEYMGIAGKLDSTDTEGYALVRHSDNKFKLWVGDGTMTSADSDSTYTDSNWHHVVGVINSGTNYLYVDGALQTDTDSTVLVDSSNVAAIGRQYYNYNQRFWQGNIDEVRISNVARSAGWIQTEYNNQNWPDPNDPNAFYALAAQETLGGCPCDDSNPCTADSMDQTTLTCIHDAAAADGTSCDDGLYCTTGEVCTAGVCASGSARDCSSEDALCSIGVCDETTDACVARDHDSWFNASWQYRKSLTIDSTKVTENLASFPVLVSMTDADLASKARSDGFDIVFTDSNATTQLDHEVELFDPNSGKLVAWVEVPSLLSSADKTLYMYYGNASSADQSNAAGVWDANYLGVWHLKEDPGPGTAGDITDSTSPANNGTAEASMTSADLVDGKIGKGFDLDGADDYVDSGLASNAATNLTLSAWFKSDDAGSIGDDYVAQRLVTQLRDSTNSRMTLGLNLDRIATYWRDAGDNVQEGTTALTSTPFYYGTLTYDGSTIRVYLNGSEEGFWSESSLTSPSSSNVQIGRQSSSGRPLDGIIDEVRVSDMARSADWIQTEYNNQNSPSTFFSAGSEEQKGSTSCSLPDCDDSNTCTVDWYDTGSSSCVNDATAANGIACNISPQSFCGAGTCFAGVCGGLSPLSRKPVTIDATKVPADLTDFPVLVSVTDSDLTIARADAFDIYFTASDGTTKLDHEVELFDPNSGQLVAWIRVPSLSSSADTLIYMYYGNPDQTTDQQNAAGVWDANYVGVWHLHDDFADSGGSNTGTNSGSTDAAGQIADGQSFDGNNDYVYTSNSFNSPQDFTVSAWFKTATASGRKIVGFEQDRTGTSSSNYDRHVYVGSDGKLYFGVYNGATVYAISTSTYSDDAWHHVVAVRDDSTNYIYLYIDGGEVDSQANSAAQTITGGEWRIGSYKLSGWSNAGDGYFPGSIDEVRVSNDARSADWIQTEYNNQNWPDPSDPNAFYAVGAEDACAAVDHFVISHDGSGIHCLGETVTVTAKNLWGNTVTGYKGAIVLSTQSGYGTWTSGGGNNGSFSDATADDGRAKYTFASADNGVATFTLNYLQGPAVIDIGVFDEGTPTIHDDDTEGTMTLRASGFTVTSSPLSNPPPNPIPAFASQTAGSELQLYITAYGTTPTDSKCGVIETYAGTKTLKLWSTYSDPTTGTRTVAIDGTTISTSSGSPTSRSTSFAAGRAVVNARYKDVGLIRIDIKDDSVPEPVGGITGFASFVSKPADFAITSITRTDDSANPGASTPAGTVFVDAGEPFKVTVEVRDAERSLTPNYGNETTPEAIKLIASTLVAPAGGRNGTANDGAIGGSFSSTTPAGTFNGSSFYWDEVGAITLQASVGDGDYLGAGDVTGGASGTVGRFKPDNFDVSTNSPAFGAACGTFTYLGQSFTYDTAPVFTVTARNAQNGTTQNYTEAGGWFKITNSTLQNRTYTPSSGTLDTSGLPSTGSDPAIGNLSAGTATLTFDSGSGLRFDRSTPVAPFDAEITLGIDVIDDDGVAYASNPAQVGAGSGIDFNGGKAMRFGRLIVENAHDSELLDLDVPLKTQYFNGTYYVDITDICTSRTTDDLNLTQNPPGLSTASIAAPLDLSFSAPGASNTGYIEIEVDLSDLSWLQFDWPADPIDGVYDDNPTGRATFGIYKGSNQIIYIREMY
jgi:hypothetical protein